MPTTTPSILIVDDEDTIRSTLSLEFQEIGYAVRSAENGITALVELGQHIPDILLSDLNMPGMSGFDLLSVVRRRYPEVRVIAMSGAFFGNEASSGVAADAFYQKGSSMGCLLKIIEALHKMKQRSSLPPKCSTLCEIAAPSVNRPQRNFRRMGSEQSAAQVASSPGN